MTKNKLDLPTACRDRLYQSLLDTSEILDRLKCDWWLGHGAVLGAVRDGDLIPWDRDLDFIVTGKADIIGALKSSGKFDSVYSHGDEHYRVILKPTADSTRTLKNCVYLYRKEGDFFVAKVKPALSEDGMFILPARFFERKAYVTIRGRTFPTFHPVEGYLSWLYGDWQTPDRRRGFRNFSTKKLRCMEVARREESTLSDTTRH